ncbi:glycosyltransferase family 4 protein [Microbacterium sp. NPDC058389]|uniref:glycosyltransferase family 4 protein n=1 Tax=Microbacterium sp. NPDC058389 TaxID=3346475 RepID=UPI00365FF342
MTTQAVAELARAAGRATRRAVTFLVADGIDDPARVSGGNVYDQHVRDRLSTAGWLVSTVPVADAAGVASALRALPDRATALVDGLVAAWAPDHIEAAGARVRLVVLAHMVAAVFPGVTAAEVEAERRALAAAHRVVVTSPWTARELERRGLVDAGRLSIAAPGAAAGPTRPEARRIAPAMRGEAVGTGRSAPGRGRRLLCVGVVAPHKGQDVLLAALARLPEHDWACAIVGSADAAPGFAAEVRRGAAGFSGRVRLTGVLGRAALAAEYARGGLLVAPSRVESAGMAIAEARARGIPVIAAAVGGIPDTVAGGGAILVRPDDPAALSAALHAWMTDPALRRRLRREARSARTGLPSWNDTAAAVGAALESA